MDLLTFEKKYEYILKDIEEWSVLRVYLRKLFHTQSPILYNKINLIKKIKGNINFIFYKFKNFFNTYEYFFISDSSERKQINNVYVDKYCDDIIDRLNGKSLLIETPNPIHYENVKTKYIISDRLFVFLSRIFYFFIKVDNNKQLDKILTNEKLFINYKKKLKLFKSQYFIYKIFLLIYKPKVIFINCYYCKPALIKVAKDLNIKVIEIQHGVIDNHDMYISYIKLNKNYFPDLLLSWGRIYNKLLFPNYPIGSWYLEYVKNHSKVRYSKVFNLEKKYRTIIGVSLQDIDEEVNNKMFDFISSLDKNILFILIPRQNIPKYEFASNIVTVNEDCYNIITNCDIHMTIYSSCALEVPSLGIPNILINCGNLAIKYYKDVLSKYHTQIVNNREDFIKAFKELKDLDKEEIKKYNSDIFENNYERRIAKFIKEYLNETD